MTRRWTWWSWVVLGACRASDPTAEPPTLLAEPPAETDALPLALTVHYVPNRLAARGEVAVEAEGTLALAYGRVGEPLDLRTPSLVVGPGDEVELPVLGLSPGEWSVAAVFDGEVGAPWTVSTSLPAGFVSAEVVMSSSNRDDGLVVCGAVVQPHVYRCVDALGNPVAYVPLTVAPMFVRALDDGTWLVHPRWNGPLTRIDRLGRLLGSWRLEDLDGLRFVHDLIDSHDVVEIHEGPWAGAWAMLTRTEDAGLEGVGVVVFDPDSRTVLWDWTAHGALGDGRSIDPDALPYERGSTEPKLPNEWQHANALSHGRTDGVDHFWISLRHQDWVIRVDTDTDRVGLRLGAGGDVQLVEQPGGAAAADAEWMFHQHAPEWTHRDDGSLEMLVVDNGNNRPGSTWYSRLVRYVVSTDRSEAWVDWSYGAPAPSEQHFTLRTAGDIDGFDNGVRFTHHDDDDGWVSEVGWDGQLLWELRWLGSGELYRTESYDTLYGPELE